jgi:hypothetical protein
MRYWREFLLVLFSWVIIWMLARGYESRMIVSLLEQKRATEKLVNQSGTPELQQIMKNLGYNVAVRTPAKPDTVKKGK